MLLEMTKFKGLNRNTSGYIHFYDPKEMNTWSYNPACDSPVRRKELPKKGITPPPQSLFSTPHCLCLCVPPQLIWDVPEVKKSLESDYPRP